MILVGPFIGGTNRNPTYIAPLTTTLTPTFATSSTPTFTRATIATVLDHEGLVRQAISGEVRFTGARRVANLCSYSEDFSNAAWTKGTVTVTTNTETSPTGTLTGDVINSAVANGKLAIFDITNAAFIVTDVAYTAGASWSRISNTVTAPAGCTSIRAYVYRLNSSSNMYNVVTVVPGRKYTFSFYTKSSSGNLAYWGAQVEDVTGQSNQAPGEYVSANVLSSPYNGANVDAVKYFATTNGNSVSSGVVTEATGSAIAASTLKGFLREEARTNICLKSETFNSTWTASNTTVATTTTVTPRGDTTAFSLTATAGNATLLQSITSASANRCFSVWIRRKTGSGNIQMTVDNGSTWTTVTTTSSFARVYITQASVTNPVVGFRIVTNADAIEVWGAQLETGSMPTSYLQTTTSSVPRNEDVLSYPTSGNVRGVAGTVYAEITWPIAIPSSSTAGFGDNRIIDLDSGRYPLRLLSGAQNLNDGTADRTLVSSWLPAANTLYKVSASWFGSVAVGAINGTVSAAATFDGDMNLGATMYVGGYSSGGYCLNGNIKNLKFYGNALSGKAQGTLTA
jgi:hypothetical protein